MAFSIRHAFSSLVADDPAAAAAGEVLPSHWNAALVTSADALSVIANATNAVAAVTAVVAASDGLVFMRSGNALAFGQIGLLGIDQTAAYAFTGLGATTISAAASGAVPLTISNYSLTGSQAQSMVSWAGTLNTSGSPDVIKIAITDTARGGSTKLFNIYAGASGTTSIFSIDRSGNIIVAAGATIGGTGNTIDIGGALEVAGGTAVQIRASAALQWSNGAIGGTSDLFLTRATTATLQLGAAAADTTGVSQTLQAQGVTTGGTNNQAGGSLTIASGQGKGNVASSLIFQTPAVGASGNTLQTMTTALTINSSQQVQINAATDASSTTTGVFTVTGGVGIAKKLFTGNGITNSSGNITTGSGDAFVWTNRSQLYSTANGQLVLRNNAQDDNTDTMFMFAGTTSAFSMFKRTKATTTIQARLSDDSAYAPLQGKLTTDTNATTGLTAGVLSALTNADIVIYDASGQAYRVPCII